MMVLFASLLLASSTAAADLSAGSVIPSDATATQLVESCRTMIPRDIELKGRLILRNRRGITQAEHDYVLTRADGQTSLVVDGEALTPPAANEAASSGSLLGTDVTWEEFSFDATRESETVHGQLCSVVLIRKGDRLVRVWVDRKTGAMMQAEELKAGKPVRRLWGTRIKKFGDRWAPNVMEVETLGSGHRTKITVEEMK